MDYLIQNVDISRSYDIIIKYIIYSDKFHLLDNIPVHKETIYYLINHYEERYQQKTYPLLRKSHIAKLFFSSLKEVYNYIIFVYERDLEIIQVLFKNFGENTYRITDEFYNLWLKNREFIFPKDKAEFEKFVALNYPNNKTVHKTNVNQIYKNYVKCDVDNDYVIFQYYDKCLKMDKYDEATIRFYYFLLENNYFDFIEEYDIAKIENMYETLSISSNIRAYVWNNEFYPPYIKYLDNSILFFYSYKDKKLIDITEHSHALITIYETTLKYTEDLKFCKLYNMFGDYVYKFLKYLLDSNFLYLDLNDDVVFTIYEHIDNKEDFFNSLLYGYLCDNPHYKIYL